MPERLYARPLPVGDPDIRRLVAASANGGAPPPLPLAGGPATFASVEVMERRDGVIRRNLATISGYQSLWERVDPQTGKASFVAWRRKVASARPPVLGLDLSRPRLMAVVNVTPDSFSDGGDHLDPERAVAHALAMVEAGADILDIGGESTRPGAADVPVEEELARVLPVIRGIVAAGCQAPISIDTRKAAVARAAFEAGARLFNDVSALAKDPDSLSAAAALCKAHPEAAVVLCHSRGDPATMQQRADYADVCLDVYDELSERCVDAVAAGVPFDRIIVDPGIGFGKTLEHNLELIRGLTLFHGLGAPVLLGASRKRFIGTLSGVETAAERGSGSVAAALMGVAKGAQILRVHDVAETAQALRVWTALTVGADE